MKGHNPTHTVALVFSQMTHGIQQRRINTRTHTLTHTKPTLSPEVACSKHHQPQKPHMPSCELGNCFNTHKNTHRTIFSQCNLRKAATTYQLRPVLFVLFPCASINYLLYFGQVSNFCFSQWHLITAPINSGWGMWTGHMPTHLGCFASSNTLNSAG